MARGAYATSEGCTYATSTSVGDLHLEAEIVNQDAVRVGASSQVFAVADGHGPDGEKISLTAAEALVQSVETRLSTLCAETAITSAVLSSLLHTAFAHAAETVDALPEAFSSGASATLLVVHEGMAAVANVGDTHVVVCREGFAEVLSEQHRTCNVRERKRVQLCGGIVQSEYLCDALDLPTKMISVTRALGDLDVRCLGVCALPFVNFVGQLFKDDLFVIATDGLWDAHGGDVTPRVAVDTVRQGFDSANVQLSVQKGADSLLALAKGNAHCPLDDTTVLVVRPPALCARPQ